MKKIMFFIVMTLFVFTSCIHEGEVYNNSTGTINGHKISVYTYGTGGGGTVKVAFIEDTINSLTYSEGKTEETTIIVNENTYYGNNTKVITGDIIMENDSMVLIKKR